MNQVFPSVKYGVPFTDQRDGKRYKTITLNGKVWMAENLRYDIPGVPPRELGTSTSLHTPIPDILVYKRDWIKRSNIRVDDREYSYDAAVAACPPGWHLPTRSEWIEAAAAANIRICGWVWEEDKKSYGPSIDFATVRVQIPTSTGTAFPIYPGGIGKKGMYTMPEIGYWSPQKLMWYVGARDDDWLACLFAPWELHDINPKATFAPVHLASVRCVKDY